MLKNGCYAFLLFNHINLRNRTETVNRCIHVIHYTYTPRNLPDWDGLHVIKLVLMESSLHHCFSFQLIPFCDINFCDIYFCEFDPKSQKFMSQNFPKYANSQKLMSQKLFKWVKSFSPKCRFRLLVKDYPRESFNFLNHKVL